MDRILVTDGQLLFAEGLVALLRPLLPGLPVPPPSPSLAGLLAACRDGPPALALVDVGLLGDAPGRGAAAVLAAAPGTRLVVLATPGALGAAARAYAAGACGCVLRSQRAAVVAAALGVVRAGGTYVPPEVLRAHAAMPAQPAPAGPAAPRLTARELAVLAGLRQGLPDKEIAGRLGSGTGTVKVHVRGLMRKLGARNRTQVVLAAAGAVPPG